MTEEGQTMPYKVVEVGGKKYAELGEGDNAIFIHPDGSEVPFDASGATSRIAALNAENATKRHENNELKRKVEAFAGIEDAEAARQALETVKNLEVGELKTAKQVQEIKDQAKIAAEALITEANRKAAQDLLDAQKKLQDLEGQLHKEKIGGGIARSKFVQEKMAIPPDMVESFFGKNLKLEEGKIVGYRADGSKIFSKKNPGDVADLEEAIEIMVGEYPNKENILKGAGGGSGGGEGAANRGGLSKEAFDKLDPVQRMNIARGVRPNSQQSGAAR